MKTELTTTLRERVTFGLKHELQRGRVFPLMRDRLLAVRNSVVVLFLAILYVPVNIVLLISQPFLFVVEPIFLAMFYPLDFERSMRILQKMGEKVSVGKPGDAAFGVYLVHDLRGIVQDTPCQTLEDAEKWMEHIQRWNPDSRCEIIYPKKS